MNVILAIVGVIFFPIAVLYALFSIMDKLDHLIELNGGIPR